MDGWICRGKKKKYGITTRIFLHIFLLNVSLDRVCGLSILEAKFKNYFIIVVQDRRVLFGCLSF